MSELKSVNKHKTYFGGNRVKLADIIIMLVISILCLTCILPFMHIASKSISSNTAVMSKSVYLLPKEIDFSAYRSIFRDGTLTRSMVYTVYMTLIFTVFGMIVTICGAYPLTKKGLREGTFYHSSSCSHCILGAGLIPEYLLMKNWDY